MLPISASLHFSPPVLKSDVKISTPITRMGIFIDIVFSSKSKMQAPWFTRVDYDILSTFSDAFRESFLYDGLVIWALPTPPIIFDIRVMLCRFRKRCFFCLICSIIWLMGLLTGLIFVAALFSPASKLLWFHARSRKPESEESRIIFRCEHYFYLLMCA